MVNPLVLPRYSRAVPTLSVSPIPFLIGWLLAFSPALHYSYALCPSLCNLSAGRINNSNPLGRSDSLCR